MSLAAPQQTHERSHTDTLEALYCINKHAKRLTKDAKQNSYPGTPTTKSPKVAGLRRDALYELKHHILSEIHQTASRVELHNINNSEFYCFYFDAWSFHIPEDALQNIPVDGHLTLPDFQTEDTPTRTNQSLARSLEHLWYEFNVNANELLERRYIQTTDGSLCDIGWGILD